MSVLFECFFFFLRGVFMGGVVGGLGEVHTGSIQKKCCMQVK